jgi:RimJ/RimL family protein N-acetyltransferase
MNTPFLSGPNTYLRPVDKADAPTLVSWFNDPELTRFLLWYRPMNLSQEEAFLDKIHASETDLILGIVTREGDRLIGCLGLHQVDIRNRHAVFGISVGDKTYWGKGHGTEAARLIIDHAFLTLNLNRVWLEVFEYNQRAMRCYEKLGFRHEGRLRQHVYRDGRYWDSLVMGILRSDWEAGRAKPGI